LIAWRKLRKRPLIAKKTLHYNDEYENEIYKVEGLEVLIDHAKYSPIYGREYGTVGHSEVPVKALLNGKEVKKTFYIQLSGGEYLSQMGCWITTTGGDCEFDEEELILYEAVNSCKDCPSLSSVAEDCYEKYLENELDDGGEWEEVEGWASDWERHIQVTATTTGTWVLEKNKQENGDKKYRLRMEKSGHVSPNDYASFPDFEVAYVDSIEDALSIIGADVEDF